MKFKEEDVAVEKIVTNSKTQMRDLDHDLVEHYAEMMDMDVTPFLPLLAVKDRNSDRFFLYDGFHRLEALKLRKVPIIPLKWTEGDERMAKFLSLAANKFHGLPREPGHIRRCILFMLADDDWGTMTTMQIAEHIGCSTRMVRKIRQEFAEKMGDAEPEAPKRPDPTPTRQSNRPKSAAGDQTGPIHWSPKSDPTEQKDRYGRYMNEGMVQAVKEFKESVNPIIEGFKALNKQLLSKYDIESALWRNFDKQPYEIQLSAVMGFLRWMRPYATCPNCGGAGGIGSECGFCKDTGWVHKSMYQRAAANLGLKEKQIDPTELSEDGA